MGISEADTWDDDDDQHSPGKVLKVPSQPTIAQRFEATRRLFNEAEARYHQARRELNALEAALKTLNFR